MFEGVHNSYTVVLATAARCSPSSAASTLDSGHSTTSTVATPSQSPPPTSTTRAANLGGGFEAESAEPHVAIYPGPARSEAHFRELVDGKPELIGVSEFLGWSSTAAFPQIPTREAVRVWRRMKLHPRFDGAHAATPFTLLGGLGVAASGLVARSGG